MTDIDYALLIAAALEAHNDLAAQLPTLWNLPQASVATKGAAFILTDTRTQPEQVTTKLYTDVTELVAHVKTRNGLMRGLLLELRAEERRKGAAA